MTTQREIVEANRRLRAATASPSGMTAFSASCPTEEQHLQDVLDAVWAEKKATGCHDRLDGFRPVTG